MENQGRFIIANGVFVQFLGGAKDVVIPSGVVRIGPGAFHGYDVETVTIPEGVIEIGNNCFNDCKNLKRVTIPASVTTISETAFRDTNGVKIVTPRGSFAWNKYSRSSQSNDNQPISTPDSSVPASHEEPAQPVNNSAKKSVAPASEKKANTAPSPNNESPASSSLEDRLKNVLANQNREAEWARLLGCKIGEEPWKMRNNFLGRADRLVARIKKITDQDLLIRIAREATLSDIQCAAIRNIHSQEVLIPYASDISMFVRRAAIVNLTDQATLTRLATTDNSTLIRDAAIKKVKDEKAVKTYLMKLDRQVTASDFDAIRNNQYLRELAITAHHYSVRKYAASLLPVEDPETKLLKAAAELSDEIVPYAVERFKNAAKQLRESNPDFLDIVALRHPLPGVRYLARGETGITPKDTGNIEEMLRSKTPSEVELQQRAQIKRCEDLLNSIRQEVNSFLTECHSASNQGKKYHERRFNFYPHVIERRSEADMLADMVRDELRNKGFTKAQAIVEPHYRTERTYIGNGEWRTNNILVGYNITANTSW